MAVTLSVGVPLKKRNKVYVAVEGADDLVMLWGAEKCLGRF